MNATLCPLCNLEFTQNVNSTQNDAILMFIAKKVGRIDLSIRSLRSTGCKARVIIFVDVSLYIPSDFASVTELCGCEVVKVNLTSLERSAPHLARFVVYRDWLEAHHKELKRVMHIDAFDTFFQHDPFTNGISDNSLDIVLEDKKIGSCPWNSAWISKCYGTKVLRTIGSNTIACSGSIGGSTKYFMRFLEVLTNLPKWSICWSPSIDQAHLNYMLYSGEMENHNIPLTYHNCNSSFLTMTWCSKKSRVIDSDGMLLNPDGEEPSFVHQYNRYPEMINYFEAECPK